MTDWTQRELAVIDAIDAAIKSEDRPDYTVLLRHAKEGHQQAYGQLASLLRLEGDKPSQSAGLIGTLATLQTRLTQMIGRTITLQAMRLVEEHQHESFRHESETSSGLRRAVFHKLANHAQQRAVILTAHIAHSKGDNADEVKRLPRPLAEYFANATPKACMRCTLDRPGAHPAIERKDPYTYVCAACHDETREAFPPELKPLIDTWPADVREARVVEKALGKPSKETAKKRVHTVMAGQPPEERGPRRAKQTGDRGHLAGPTAGAPATTQLAHDQASPTERAYSEQLFDARQLRKHW